MHDAKLAGVLSETTRQIDVLIENENLGTRVIVDCKDRKRPVNIVDASAFAGLMEDVEATAGVLICNRGFSKSTRTYAKKKGFSLARLHDVESRRWRLDVLMPIVWTKLYLRGLSLTMRVHLNAGDRLVIDSPPVFIKEERNVDIKAFFEESWNNGELHTGEPGEGTLGARLDFQLSDGEIRKDADIQIRYVVGGEAFVGETVKQEPAGGWTEILNPKELAVQLAGTVVSLEETTGVEVEFTGINQIQGAEKHNQQIRWSKGAH